MKLSNSKRPSNIHDAPKLLVEWSPPWREFVSSIRPALARSERRLAGEAPFGLIPLAHHGALLCAGGLSDFCGDRDPSEDRAVATVRRAQTFAVTMSSITAATNFPAPKISAALRPERPAARAATKRTIAPRPSRSPAAALWSRRLWTRPTSSFLLRATRWRTCWPSSRIPVLRLRKGCARPERTPNLAAALVAPRSECRPRLHAQRSSTRLRDRSGAIGVARPHTHRAQSQRHTDSAGAQRSPASIQLVAPALAPAIVPPAPSVSRDSARTAPSLNAVGSGARSERRARDQARSTPALAANVIPPAPEV